MSEFVLKADKRSVSGSNAVKKLRAENLVPAELYQRDSENLSLQVVEKELEKIINDAGQSAIIQLDVNGEEHNVIIREYQKHPFKNQFLHVDFFGVNMNETLKVTVPVVLLNIDEIYVQPSVLMQFVEEIEIETLPKYIPQQVELDVQELKLGESLTVADIELLKDENITLITDEDTVICTLNEPQEIELDDEVEDVDADSVEVIGEEEDKVEDSEE